MPDVKPNEKQSDYMSRCMPIVMKENGGNQKAAAGKCLGMYKQHKKHKKSMGCEDCEPVWDEVEFPGGFYISLD